MLRERIAPSREAGCRFSSQEGMRPQGPGPFLLLNQEGRIVYGQCQRIAGREGGNSE
jgi:hypothetical protein